MCEICLEIRSQGQDAARIVDQIIEEKITKGNVFILAVKNANYKVIAMLLRSGYRHEFMTVARYVSRVDEMISSGMIAEIRRRGINITQALGPTLIGEVYYHNLTNVEMLLKAGVDPNFVYTDTLTALCMRFEREGLNNTSVKILALLFRYGADPNARDACAFKTLITSSDRRAILCATLFINNGLDMKKYGQLALLWAVRNHLDSEVENILSRGATTDVENPPAYMEISSDEQLSYAAALALKIDVGALLNAPEYRASESPPSNDSVENRLRETSRLQRIWNRIVNFFS
jgi:hypothetical protein